MWIRLKLEPSETIRLFEKEWNDFDRLTPETKMLHNTRRITQPVQDRRECMEKGIVSDDMLRDEMRRNHVRHDAFALLERTTSLAT